MIRIRPIASPEDLATARSMIREYADSLGIDLSFQAFEEELAGLPGDYAPPRGRLLLATWQEQPAGCVALRPLEAMVCEMKRLYSRPEFRGRGIGRALAREVIALARAIGYDRMRLDTLSNMTEALALYRSLGFRPIPPYRHNPIEGAVYLELTLEEL